jgi:hypothetical protein
MSAVETIIVIFLLVFAEIQMALSLVVVNQDSPAMVFLALM